MKKLLSGLIVFMAIAAVVVLSLASPAPAQAKSEIIANSSWDCTIITFADGGWGKYCVMRKWNGEHYIQHQNNEIYDFQGNLTSHTKQHFILTSQDPTIYHSVTIVSDNSISCIITFKYNDGVVNRKEHCR